MAICCPQCHKPIIEKNGSRFSLTDDNGQVCHLHSGCYSAWRLRELEGVIKRNGDGFLESCLALCEIEQLELHKQTGCDQFEEYCEKCWFRFAGSFNWPLEAGQLVHIRAAEFIRAFQAFAAAVKTDPNTAYSELMPCLDLDRRKGERRAIKVPDLLASRRVRDRRQGQPLGAGGASEIDLLELCGPFHPAYGNYLGQAVKLALADYSPSPNEPAGNGKKTIRQRGDIPTGKFSNRKPAPTKSRRA